MHRVVCPAANVISVSNSTKAAIFQSRGKVIAWSRGAELEFAAIGAAQTGLAAGDWHDLPGESQSPIAKNDEDEQGLG